MSGASQRPEDERAEPFGDETLSQMTAKAIVDIGTLLTRTEALLIARAAFEQAIQRGPIEPAEDSHCWFQQMHLRAFDIFLEANRLFADLLGDEVFNTFYSPSSGDESASEMRGALASRLRLFRSLLSKPDWSETLRRFISEVEDLDGGDIPDILTPERRAPGQAKQPRRIARLRFRALCWDEHLKHLGISAAERQSAISTAYKTGWEAIRKWRGRCEAIFGLGPVEYELRHATQSYWAEYENGHWLEALNGDGSHYYEVWRNQRGNIAP